MKLLDWEKQHNALLRELSLSLKGLAATLSPDTNLLVVPQNVAIEHLIMSKSFAEAHAVHLNPAAPAQGVTLDGKRRLLISDDRNVLYALPGEPLEFENDDGDLSSFWEKELPNYEREKQHVARSLSRAESYVILREGSVDLGIFGGKGPVPVVLISHALKPVQGGEWSAHPSTQGDSTLADPFLVMSPMQSSSPREVYESESEAEVVDRIAKVFSSTVPPPKSAGSSAAKVPPPLLPRISQPPPTSAAATGKPLDWIFELGAVGALNKPSSEAPSAAAVAGGGGGTSSLLSRASAPSSAAAAERKAEERKKRAEEERLERERREKHKAAFFEKMKHRKAADLVQGVKSFVTKFVDKPPPDGERRAEVVRNFMRVLEDKIRAHTLWNNASDDELDEMSETLERFVLSKLYRVIFAPSPTDLERDEALKRRIIVLKGWLEPKHLDIQVDLTSKRSLRVMALAVEQLQKMNSFKAPRDKMVCILNACKAVWKLLGGGGKPAGADDFLPNLIWVVIQANPPNLHSTVDYISNYRHPDKMAQEFGYYFTQLASVVPFLENMSYKMLSDVSQDDFERLMGGERPLRRSASSAILPDVTSTTTSTASNQVPPMQRAASVAALMEHPQQQKEFVRPPPPAQAVASKTRTFKFVGRKVDTLTLGEVKELLVEYEKMALELTQ